MKDPQTNVVGVFGNAAKAKAAVDGLTDAGFAKDAVSITRQGGQTVVTVKADARHAEASASLDDDGATGVQNVAR